MKQHSPADTQKSAIQAALAALVAVPLFVLYRIVASKTGIWEPWESDVLDWGQVLANTDGASALLPIARGDFVPVPWLQSLLAMAANAFGDAPVALRTPWTLMATVSVATVTYCYARIFGPARGALIGGLFGLVPCVLLSATNAAGIVPFASMYSCALATYSLTRRPDCSPWAWLAVGLFSGLTMWAGLLPGLAALLYTVLGFQIGIYRGARRSPIRTGLALVLALVALFLAITSVSQGDDGIYVTRGLAGYLVLPLAGFVYFAPLALSGDRQGVALKWTGWLAAGAMMLLPTIGLLEHLSLDEVGSYLLDPQPVMVSATVESAPFSDLIRIAGFALFPLTALLFYAVDYLARTVDSTFVDTDDVAPATVDAKLLLLSSVAATFGVFAIMYRASSIHLFGLPLGVVAIVALSLSDRAYLRWLTSQPMVLRLHAITVAVMMLVLSKDVRGMFDEEAGRPGPRVIIEFLTEGTSLKIPDSYAFGKMRLFVLCWLLIVVVGWFAGPAVYAWWRRRRSQPVIASVQSAMVGLSGAVWIAISVLFFAVLGWIYIPQLDVDLSSNALATRLAELEDEGSTLVFADDAKPWALRDREVETFSTPSGLRSYFCEADGRVFAVLQTDELPRYNEEIRSKDPRQDSGCETGFHVLFGRSERYALVSNELRRDANESDEGLLADAIVTEDEIPPTARRFDPPYTLDGKLELIAAQITPDALVSGDFEVATWWRVKQAVSRDYEMFIHVDGPGSRINGDHELVGGKYPVNRWVKGDIIVDRYSMSVSLFGDAKGEYSVLVGMFKDDDRMSVEPKVHDNRIEVGKLRVLWPFVGKR